MTDNEIIKALECCKTGDCIHCPKWKNEYIAGECNDILRFALNLINRQKAEIEALKMDNGQIQSDVINVNLNLDHITKLWEYEKEKVVSAKQKVINACKMRKTARTEAIKEFAERLKESAFVCDVSFGYGKEHYTHAVPVIKIDNLVKEMVGEYDGNL